MYTGNVMAYGQDVRAILINDFTGAPTWYKGVTYSKLAPSHELMVKYANGLEWGSFESQFRRELKKLDAVSVVSELCDLTGMGPEGEMSPILICWCDVEHKIPCHRQVVAAWLNEELGLTIKELSLYGEVIFDMKRYGNRKCTIQ